MILLGRKGYKAYSVEEEEILPHFLIIGGTGKGKTTLAASICRSLRKFVVIDPHGDLCWRTGSPVYFPGELYFNPIGQGGEEGISEMIYLIKDAFGKEFWGPRTEHLLVNLLKALGEGANLADLYFSLTSERILEALERRRRVRGISGLREDAILSLLNKISPFLLRTPLRETFCRRDENIPDLPFSLNVDVSIYGRENSRIISSFFFSHIFLSDLRRRERFWIVCDEFQFIRSRSFFTALSEGRKYGISLLLIASSLPKEEVSEILGNLSGLAIFKVDFPTLRTVSKYYDVKEGDIIGLGPGEFILILGEEKRRLKTIYFPPKQKREPRPENIKLEDVMPIKALEAAFGSHSKRELRLLGLLNSKGEISELLYSLLSTFP